MVKFICDACGKELTNERKFYFDYLEKTNYGDNKENTIERFRRKKRHFCLQCYFELIAKLLAEIKTMRDAKGI
jgi:hypothetical protein